MATVGDKGLIGFLVVLALTDTLLHLSIIIIFFIVVIHVVVVFRLLRLENGKPADEGRADEVTQSDVVLHGDAEVQRRLDDEQEV